MHSEPTRVLCEDVWVLLRMIKVWQASLVGSRRRTVDEVETFLDEASWSGVGLPSDLATRDGEDALFFLVRGSSGSVGHEDGRGRLLGSHDSGRMNDCRRGRGKSKSA